MPAAVGNAAVLLSGSLKSSLAATASYSRRFSLRIPFRAYMLSLCTFDISCSRRISFKSSFASHIAAALLCAMPTASATSKLSPGRTTACTSPYACGSMGASIGFEADTVLRCEVSKSFSLPGNESLSEEYTAVLSERAKYSHSPSASGWVRLLNSSTPSSTEASTFSLVNAGCAFASPSLKRHTENDAPIVMFLVCLLLFTSFSLRISPLRSADTNTSVFTEKLSSVMLNTAILL